MTITATARPWIMQYEFASYSDAKAFQEMLQESGYEELAINTQLRQRYDYFKPEAFAAWPQTIAMRQVFSGRSFDTETLAIALQEHGWGGSQQNVRNWLSKGAKAEVLTRLERGIYEFTRRPLADTACAKSAPEPLSCAAL